MQRLSFQEEKVGIFRPDTSGRQHGMNLAPVVGLMVEKVHRQKTLPAWLLAVSPPPKTMSDQSPAMPHPGSSAHCSIA